MKIQGKFNSAVIYTDNVDAATLSQVYNMLNNPCFENTHIAIMPDVHMGRGSVVGFTMTSNDYINPNVIGVDIGCGIDAYKIGRQTMKLDLFDSFVRKKIPAGRKVHSQVQGKYFQKNQSLNKLIEKVSPDELKRIIHSIGTLGGGNHFLELDKDENENLWLVIHSGSRNLGLQVYTFHQQSARAAIKKRYKGAGAYHRMEYMTVKEGGEEYLHDMKIAQEYAEENRKVMARIIIEEFFKMKFEDCEIVSSVHNYVNFDDNIVRKGAISAHKGEKVIIPLNMRDGCLIASGKGNKEWNYSAPHGAGRLLSRSESKTMISIDDYKNSMKGIYSSCVSENTIDESPMVYKDSNEIKALISDTVEIESNLMPIYNFKA